MRVLGGITLLTALCASSLGGQDTVLRGVVALAAQGPQIQASDLEPSRVSRIEGRRVQIRGDLVRLGRDEIGADFGVADATGIAPLEFDPDVIASPALLEKLLQAHHVVVGGEVEVGGALSARSGAPRISVSRAEDVVFTEAPPYRAIAQVLGAFALALLIVYLVSRKQGAERRAREVARFTRELARRDSILKAVGYGAERFLRNDSWEDSLPEALERLGRAADVTRASVYRVVRNGGAPGVVSAGEWIDEQIVAELGAEAASDVDLGQARLPRWRECFIRDEVVMGSISTLPPDERAYLESRGLRSIIAIPIPIAERLGGLLLLADHRKERDWPDTERDALLIAARMVGAAIERRQTQMALAEAEDRFRQMAEHIREVFYMTDATTGEVLYLSPAYEEVWGRSREDTLADLHSFTDAILPEDRHLMLEDARRTAIGQTPAERQLEYRIRRPDGAIRWIRNRSFRIYGPDGRPHRVAGVCTDITQQKQLEEELRRANRIEAMGHLAAGIAHEINTPIQYIGGNLEFLDASFRDLRVALEAYGTLLAEVTASSLSPQRLEEITALIDAADVDFIVTEAPRASSQALDGVRRVSEIVRAMKEFSHPGSGSPAMTDLNRAIQSTTTVARNEWKYVAELVTELDPELPLVPCVEGEVNQAILNLVVNAAHAIADRQVEEGHHNLGTITISSTNKGEFVEIRVSDTGTGIPEEIRSRIFDPFFTTKEVGRGTGQGLTFVHAIVVDQHAGTVTFESERGRGTTFIVRLPLAQKVADFGEAA